MKRFRFVILVTSGLLGAAMVIQAQEKKMEMPKPGPEVRKLDYFVGHWGSEGEMKPSPWGPGGKFSGDSHCTWMPGGYFVECHEDGMSPMGKMHSLGVLGYDATAKNYTYNGFNSMGENEKATGTVEGKVWTYTNETVMNGKTIKSRYIMTETSPASYDFKLDTSEDGKTWTSMMEGKVTKAASGEKKSDAGKKS